MKIWAILLFACAMVWPISAGETEHEEDVYSSVNGDFSASHILIQYRGVDKASASANRSKKEAQQKAETLLAQLQKNPESFEAVARAESDGPSAKLGGYLGGFNRRDMAPKFEAMVKKLKPGELAPSVVKTAFGYHIIRREPMKQRNYGVAAILIAHRSANVLNSLKKVPNVYTRTNEEAKQRSEQAKRALAQKSFEEVASELGDLPRSGGFFGVFRKGDGQLSDRLVEEVSTMELGAHGDIVELPIGWAILKRIAVVRFGASRIWIAHEGAVGARKRMDRTREQAAALAQQLADQINSNPGAFEDLAKEYSAGAFSVRGGKMATWFKGVQPQYFEDIVEGLKVGEITQAPVATPGGFFIVKRDK